MDHAGISQLPKIDLVALCKDVCRTVKRCGLQNRASAFQNPTLDERSFDDKLAARMPKLPPASAWVRNWEAFRDWLPELSKSAILLFLQDRNRLAREGSRVWLRGMQRAMDMGNLSRMIVVPAKGGTTLWLGLR